MDLSRPVIYRAFSLNAGDDVFADARIPGVGAGTGLTGCILDSAQMSDVDVVQFLEKRSQQDGMDAGTPFFGTRRIRLSGTIYALTRALLFDAMVNLRAALNPVLATRESPLDYGYRPFYFSWPTNRIADYPSGAIDLMVMAMPRAVEEMFTRDASGGSDVSALAIPWQATLICKDPGIYGATAQDFVQTTQTIVTGATAAASTDLITKTSHGLVAGDRVQFTTLTGGTGLNLTTVYYVRTTGLTSSAFSVSTTGAAGGAVDITVNYTTVQYVKSVTNSGTLTNRGTYLARVEALWVVGPQSGSIVATIGDSTFTVTVPSSTVARTIRFKGVDKVLTLQEAGGAEVPRMDLITFANDTTWPQIDYGPSPYSITTHGCVLTTGSHFWFYEQYA